MVEAMETTGNPSSVHGPGREARRRVEKSRSQIAELVGAQPADVVFTSGATEANNLAIRSAQAEGVTCLVSAVEHESIGNIPGVESLPVTEDGLLDLDALQRAVGQVDGAIFLSLMAANNETGAVQPVELAAEIVRGHGGAIHCDAVQGVGRLALDGVAGQVDSMSISAHKIGGPQGVGALVLTGGKRTTPMMYGGAQEDRRRAGTENVAGIAGFGAAAVTAAGRQSEIQRLAELRDWMEERLSAADPDLVVLSKAVRRIANTSCFASVGLPAETQVMAMDLEGFAISAGSACSSGKVGASHVPLAMGIDPEFARCAVRVSIGHETTEADIDGFVHSWSRLRVRHAASAA